MLSVDMECGAAQVVMSDKIPVMILSAFVFNSFVAIIAISPRANMQHIFAGLNKI